VASAGIVSNTAAIKFIICGNVLPFAGQWIFFDAFLGLLRQQQHGSFVACTTILWQFQRQQSRTEHAVHSISVEFLRNMDQNKLLEIVMLT